MRTQFIKSLLVGLSTIILGSVSSYAAPICYDFNDNQVPTGAQLGDGLQGTARIQNGMLQINLAGVNGDCGSFFIPDPSAGAPQSSLLMTWRSYIGNGNAGADGYSMSWGAAVNPGCVGEDGVGGSDLIVSIDTFDNGAGCDDCNTGTDYGIAVDWRGTRVAYDQTGRAASGNKNFLRKGQFVDATVLVENNTATFIYDGITISGPVDIGTTPVTGGNFMFGGRTGGANDNHWIDDLFINCFTTGAISVTDQPDDAAVIEGGTATFLAQVDGTPPYTYEWRSNGVVIASGTTYHRNRYLTTPPATVADDGDQYQLRASNANGSVTTREAVLDVQVNPRVLKVSATAANSITVLYSSPVQLAPGIYTFDSGAFGSTRAYGASHSEVVLTPDVDLVLNQTYTLEIRDVLGEGSNLPILPNPTTRTFRFGFGTPFCADFNDNQVPPGTQVLDGGLGTAIIADGVLKLNLDGVNGDCGGYFVPNQAGAAPLDFLAVTWKSLIGGINDPGEAQQFGHGADGYSFSWGSGVTATCVGEAGMGNDLIVSVDTFDNGGAEVDSTPGIEIRWRGTRVAARLPVPGNKQASKDFMRKGRFVDVGLLVKDGNATLNYDGITIGGPLPGFGEGLANANFLFGGRTGGANDNQWIDDLKINCFTAGPAVVVQDPTDTTVRDGDSASFSVVVDGTPPYSFQWYKNGQPIAGANSSTYVTPPTTAADEGAQFHVVVSNEAGSDTSATATLHVNIVPRVTRVFSRGNNRVHVLYSSPVQLDSGNYIFNMGEFGSTREYGASHSEVVLTTDIELAEGISYTLEISDVLSESSNLPLDPNPTVVQFGHGFGTPICFDFNDNQTPPNTQLGDGVLNTARIENGVLRLTDAQNGDCGSFFIPNQAGAAPLSFLVATWRSYIGDGASGADGYSFNWGSDVTAGCAGAVEDGTTGTGLVVGVDTFDNGTTPGDIAVDGPSDYGIEIKWRGQRVAYDKAGRTVATPGKEFLRKSRFVDVTLSVDNGVATLNYDGIVISGTLANFGAGIANGNFLLAARTGGANDNHLIDDLRINCFARDGLVVTDEPDDATVAENCVNRATFVAEVDGFPPYNYEWTENGTVVASGATYSRRISYTTPPVDRTDDGNRYQLRVTNEAGSVATREAVLTVTTTTPALVAAEGLNEQVMVIFSEGMDPATAGNTANYSINGGFSVNSATVLRGNDRVLLTVSPTLPSVDCLRLTVSGIKDCTTLDTVNATVPITIKGAIQGSGPQNLIVVEAEDWDLNQSPGSINTGGAQGRLDENRWVQNTALAGYVGTGYAEAVPNLTSFGGNLPSEPAFNASPRMHYKVNFPVAGTYYIWVRGNSGNDGGNNSLHMALDGVSADDRGRRIGNRIQNWGDPWGWVNDAQTAPAAIDVATAGVHTLSILMREDGMKIDRFLLTTDSAFTVAEAGPPASPRASTADTTPPTITCPENVTAECAGPNGTPVNYPPATATDACDANVTVTCSPPSGSAFPVGTTTVNCVATDDAQNQSRCSFTVTVVDTRPPTITCPNDIRVAPGAPVTFAPTASDACDSTPAVVCTPPSGSAFPAGATTVTCTATDDSQNSASCSFTVTVSDNEPPQCKIEVACALTYDNDPNCYVVALDNEAACVVLDGSGSTDPDGDTLTYVWVVDGTMVHTGAVFAVRLPLGCHSVVLIVSDGRGGTSRCEKTVCVITPCQGLQRCIDLVDEASLGRKNKRPLIASLKAACASFDRGNTESGMNQMNAFQNKVRAQVSRSNPEEAEAFNKCIDDLREAIECSATLELEGVCGEDNGE